MAVPAADQVPALHPGGDPQVRVAASTMQEGNLRCWIVCSCHVLNRRDVECHLEGCGHDLPLLRRPNAAGAAASLTLRVASLCLALDLTRLYVCLTPAPTLTQPAYLSTKTQVVTGCQTPNQR